MGRLVVRQSQDDIFRPTSLFVLSSAENTVLTRERQALAHLHALDVTSAYRPGRRGNERTPRRPDQLSSPTHCELDRVSLRTLASKDLRKDVMIVVRLNLAESS